MGNCVQLLTVNQHLYDKPPEELTSFLLSRALAAAALVTTVSTSAAKPVRGCPLRESKGAFSEELVSML